MRFVAPWRILLEAPGQRHFRFKNTSVFVVEVGTNKMLDFFTIFSKGGIVLWCFQSTGQAFTPSVNALIKSVILQERSGVGFTHEALKLQYKLDNEFELVFVVAYQKILQLSYVDKLISDVAMEFRNKYKDDLQNGNVSRNFDFTEEYKMLLKNAENASALEAKVPKQMKSFQESQKSKKTVSSMIENKKEEPVKKGKKNKNEGKQEPVSNNKPNVAMTTAPQTASTNGELDEETIMKNREKLFNRGKNKKLTPKAAEKEKENQPQKKGKVKRVWDLEGNNSVELDYSDKSSGDAREARDLVTAEEHQLVGQLKGNLQDLQPESSEEEDEEEEEEEEVETIPQTAGNKSAPRKGFGGFGLLSGLRNLVGSKTLTREDIEPALSKMKDHLISKNVAADVSEKLCDSVATKLEGKVMGTFSSVASTVKQSLEDSCVQILSPKCRVDILRDALDAKSHNRPYVITFCGVNGVGKSTNLAKICFWLIENGFRVLIAACDTFRAGAVEQLKTHMRKLNTLHPAEKYGGQERVSVYEKGYGKDPAGIAMEAINFARDRKIDIVLIDTAGRMQDNEPLMRALAKLIKVNQPDLVLFVGEALVGNDAIDQLTKFNQSLADHSHSEKPQLIDGIVLTKFDTIDDKVGAAISMTYTTGQPIVFVGTGQTYTDLRNLNAKAVVHALLKN